MEERKRMEALREKAKQLRESLGKSNVTTEKIVFALGSFDHRLSSLDSTVKPIQGKMHETVRCHENINKCLRRTETILQHFDRIREIEVAIFKGPSDDLDGFLEGMDQLIQTINYFNSRKNWRTTESVLSHANSLLSKATNMAEIEFHKMIKKLSKPIEPDELFVCLSKQSCNQVSDDKKRETEINDDKLPTLISPKYIRSLNSIALRLVLAGRHMRCLQIYRESRAFALETSLKYLGLHRLGKEQLHKMEWESLEAKIPSWIDIMRISVMLLFAAERQLCDQVLQGIENEFRDRCFSEVTSNSLSNLLIFPETIVRTRKSPEKLFVLLDLYDAMSEIQPEVKRLFTGEPCAKMLQSVSILHKRLTETTAETFEGFAIEVEKDPHSKPTPNGASHPLTSYVMNFIRLLFDYKAVLEKLLGEYGKGKENAADLQFLPAILRILQALQNNLEAKSKHYKELGLGYIFMTNNIHKMVTSVLKTDVMKEVLGDDWIQRKRRIVQQNSNLYRRTCWGKVTESLSSQGLVSSSGGGDPGGSFSSNALKHLVKERFKTFNAQLEETHEKHCLWKVQDEDLKDNLRLIVAEIVLPAYTSFSKRFGPIVESSKTKYLKYTPEDIERFVGELFEGKAPV